MGRQLANRALLEGIESVLATAVRMVVQPSDSTLVNRALDRIQSLTVFYRS